MSKIRPAVAVLAVFLMALPTVAQTVSTGPRLRIVALEGNNATNYIGVQSSTAPVVEVRDESDRPIEGATVVFKLPTTGPGGTFEGGLAVQTKTTDSRGQAGATGYTINDRAGSFVIEVNATYQNRAGRLLIKQTNSASGIPPELGGTPKKSSKKKWIIFAIAAGAAATATGVYLGTRNGNDPISVGSGPIVVGGPR